MQPALRRRALVVPLAILMCSLLSGSAFADAPATSRDTNHSWDVYRAPVDGSPEATLITPDPLDEATFAPCASEVSCSEPPRTCKRATRDNRYWGPVPPNASQLQMLYLVPSGRASQWYDLPIVCDDGSFNESVLGYSMHNTRSWMAGGRPRTTQGDRMTGRAFNVLFRKVSAYAYNFTFYDAMHIGLWHSEPWYYTNTAALIADELRQRGWGGPSRPNVKYVGWADVENREGAGGAAEYGGQFAFGYRRWRIPQSNGTFWPPVTAGPSGTLWGCATDGDSTVMQEILHNWRVVAQGSADHDGTHHVTQENDIMFAVGGQSTLSGTRDAGIAAPRGASVWDAGAETYTSRVLAFPAYLGARSSVWLRRC